MGVDPLALSQAFSPLATFSPPATFSPTTSFSPTTRADASSRTIPEPTPWDVVVIAGATHRLSRLVAKDPVTSPLRAPFARFKGTTGPAELAEEVRGSGLRKAIGELLTCPFCTGMWISTGFAAGLVFAPRPTRLAAGTLTALAASDLLHFARTRIQQAAAE